MLKHDLKYMLNQWHVKIFASTHIPQCPFHGFKQHILNDAGLMKDFLTTTVWTIVQLLRVKRFHGGRLNKTLCCLLLWSLAWSSLVYTDIHTSSFIHLLFLLFSQWITKTELIAMLIWFYRPFYVQWNYKGAKSHFSSVNAPPLLPRNQHIHGAATMCLLFWKRVPEPRSVKIPWAESH